MKYRKKPIVIEAYPVPDYNDKEAWKKFQIWSIEVDFPGLKESYPAVYVDTLEGRMYCCPGDFIIKGVNGEFYPCKKDIFEKTYDVVIE